MIVQRVERSAHGTTREEHIVDKHDRGTVDARRRHLGRLWHSGRVVREIVAVHRDVELADWHRCAFDALDGFGDALGQDLSLIHI